MNSFAPPCSAGWLDLRTFRQPSLCLCSNADLQCESPIGGDAIHSCIHLHTKGSQKKILIDTVVTNLQVPHFQTIGQMVYPSMP